MRRRLALACLLLVAGSPAQALQLGDLRIQSGPGEPLVAQIELPATDRIDLAAAEVDLASDRAHAAAGINPQTLPPSLDLALERQGQARIRLTTRAPIATGDNPLEFVVVLSWPEGRLLRPYGIESTGTTLRATTGSDLRYGPTRATDTLYRIAETVRPEAVATNQMMLALLEENPGSFNTDNINALQREAYLRIPQGETLQFPDAAAANREVVRQLQAWQGPGLPLRETEADASTSSTAVNGDVSPRAGQPASGTDGALLRLLPPESAAGETTAEPGMGAGVTSESLAALGAQLGRVEASNERLSADNRALRRTLLDLQTDVARLESLLSQDPASARPEVEGPASTADASEITGAMVMAWFRERLDWALANPRAAVREPWVQGWLAGVGGLLVLLLLIVRRGRRRRRLAARDGDSTLPSHWRPQAGRPADEEPAVETRLGETRVRPAQTEPVDPLERASELIAYGQLQQAQALLDDALGEEPDSIELRLKLLDVLAMREDRAGFESEAHVLQAQINDDHDERWRHVARKGKALSPEHPLFRS